MNKKERFCDVDNIVEWRHIITILLVLVAVAGQAQIHYRLEGNILARGLRGVDIDRKLKEIFNDNK